MVLARRGGDVDKINKDWSRADGDCIGVGFMSSVSTEKSRYCSGLVN